MSIRLIMLGVAALSLTAAGAAGGHYVAGRQEAKRVENCAADIKDMKVDRCPTGIKDAFSSLELGQAQRDVAAQGEIIVVQGQSRAADLAELERLRGDIAALMAAPVTSQCAAAPAMVALREQLCREVGGEGCEPSL